MSESESESVSALPDESGISTYPHSSRPGQGVVVFTTHNYSLFTHEHGKYLLQVVSVGKTLKIVFKCGPHTL